MKNKKRSPFFYVGDKYKLMPQLIKSFPENINNYYEPFVGGGSSALYVDAKKYVLNDINKHIILLHSHIGQFSKNPDKLFDKLYSIIKEYNLSSSYLGHTAPDELKKAYPKTYYSKYNKENYNRLTEDHNKDKDPSKLYILLVYGFNHMIRFNSKNEFNLPVGNVDFNGNVVSALNGYLKFVSDKQIELLSKDYAEFIAEIDFKNDDFIYFDPPYLIAKSEYNKGWAEEDETSLYKLLDDLNDKGIQFGLSNVTDHKGLSNDILKKWMRKYQVHTIKSNYISRFDNTIKKGTKEVYVTNY